MECACACAGRDAPQLHALLYIKYKLRAVPCHRSGERTATAPRDTHRGSQLRKTGRVNVGCLAASLPRNAHRLRSHCHRYMFAHPWYTGTVLTVPHTRCRQSAIEQPLAQPSFDKRPPTLRRSVQADRSPTVLHRLVPWSIVLPCVCCTLAALRAWGLDSSVKVARGHSILRFVTVPLPLPPPLLRPSRSQMAALLCRCRRRHGSRHELLQELEEAFRIPLVRAFAPPVRVIFLRPFPARRSSPVLLGWRRCAGHPCPASLKLFKAETSPRWTCTWRLAGVWPKARCTRHCAVLCNRVNSEPSITRVTDHQFSDRQ